MMYGYGIGSSDRLYNSITEALVDYLDQRDPLPEVVDVYGYRPITQDIDTSRILEAALKCIDEECEFEEPTHPTDAMRAATGMYVSWIIEQYKPVPCVPTGEVTPIDVRLWVERNAPEWLEERQ